MLLAPLKFTARLCKLVIDVLYDIYSAHEHLQGKCQQNTRTCVSHKVQIFSMKDVWINLLHDLLEILNKGKPKWGS